MLRAITPKTQMIWLCNPNNPTGTYVTHQAIADFMTQVPATVTVVVDEPTLTLSRLNLRLR